MGILQEEAEVGGGKVTSAAIENTIGIGPV